MSNGKKHSRRRTAGTVAFESLALVGLVALAGVVGFVGLGRDGFQRAIEGTATSQPGSSIGAALSVEAAMFHPGYVWHEALLAERAVEDSARAAKDAERYVSGFNRHLPRTELTVATSLPVPTASFPGKSSLSDFRLWRARRKLGRMLSRVDVFQNDEAKLAGGRRIRVSVSKFTDAAGKDALRLDLGSFDGDQVSKKALESSYQQVGLGGRYYTRQIEGRGLQSRDLDKTRRTMTYLRKLMDKPSVQSDERYRHVDQLVFYFDQPSSSRRYRPLGVRGADAFGRVRFSRGAPSFVRMSEPVTGSPALDTIGPTVRRAAQTRPASL